MTLTKYYEAHARFHQPLHEFDNAFVIDGSLLSDVIQVHESLGDIAPDFSKVAYDEAIKRRAAMIEAFNELSPEDQVVVKLKGDAP